MNSSFLQLVFVDPNIGNYIQVIISYQVFNLKKFQPLPCNGFINWIGKYYIFVTLYPLIWTALKLESYINFFKPTNSDWFGSNTGWLSRTLGRNGTPMRTLSELWMDKLKSSSVDSLQNLFNSNYIVYKIFEVVELLG
jgi:hypothetical protein